LRDSIWCFYQKCHELPKICDFKVILLLWYGTNYQALVHELGRDQPKTMKEPLNITTGHASGEEEVGAIFSQSSGKAAPNGGRGAPPKATDKGTKRGARSDRRGLKQWPKWVVVPTSYDEGDNDKDVGDSDEELVAATER
jgi:hypothetical protein